MEHLALEIFEHDGSNGQFSYMEPDTSITIIIESPLFGSGNVWSFPFSLNIAANLHIFGSAGELHGDRLHDRIDKRPARLWVDGIPMFYGLLRLDSEVTVADGSVDVTFSSGRKSFEERIEGGKANQVPLLSDVLLGMALWRKRQTVVHAKIEVTPVMDDETRWQAKSTLLKPDAQTDVFAISGSGQEFPKYVVPYGSFKDGLQWYSIQKSETVNTDSPYDDSNPNDHPYCNIAICYQKKGFPLKDEYDETSVDYSQEPVAQRGYEVSPADRVNTAPCFYVMYWLRALFTHMAIPIVENQMQDVQDLRRLFFVNTLCGYEVPTDLTSEENLERYGCYGFGVDGELDVTLGTPVSYVAEDRVKDQLLDAAESKLQVKDAEETGEPEIEGMTYGEDPRDHVTGYKISFKQLTRHLDWFCQEKEYGNVKRRYSQGRNAFVFGDYGFLGHLAYATPDNFPNVDISKVMESLESGFGVRFVFDRDYTKVRIVLLRNVLRSTKVQEVVCDVVNDEKTESSVRGFRMTYGGSGDDTAFAYKPFQDALPSGNNQTEWEDKSDTHDYSQMKTDARYDWIRKNVSAFNKTCYVTPNDGNAYGIKVDKDAKRFWDLYPSLFELAGFMDAEDGDCSGDEDTVKEIKVGFMPAIMNDTLGDNDSQRQSFALFVDEEMEPRRYQFLEADRRPDHIYFVDWLYRHSFDMDDDQPDLEARKTQAEFGNGKLGEFSMMSDLYVMLYGAETKLVFTRYWGSDIPSTTFRVPMEFDLEGAISEGYRLYLQDNFTPNDDGVAPIETHDWGLMLGVMRGSGDDATVRAWNDDQENEGNQTWEIEAGSSATAHPDTCDDYGRQWDYNGDQGGVGDTDGRFSLKLRAEKPNPDFDPSQPETHYDPEHPEENTNPRYLPITEPALQRRGLLDQFHAEESYWWRNARVAKRQLNIGAGALHELDMTVRARIGDVTGFIKKLSIPISMKKGIGIVTAEQMYI